MSARSWKGGVRVANVGRPGKKRKGVSGVLLLDADATPRFLSAVRPPLRNRSGIPGPRPTLRLRVHTMSVTFRPRRRIALSRTVIACTLAFVLDGCATNPATGKRELSLIGESQEISLGAEGAKAAADQMGIYADSAVQRYVSSLGQRIAAIGERPGLPWSFAVVDDPIVNAFALPGGPIFVSRGILTYMNSEAQLVSVLGHEVGHVTAKHSVNQLSKQSSWAGCSPSG